jgi:hypothetical protein
MNARAAVTPKEYAPVFARAAEANLEISRSPEFVAQVYTIHDRDARRCSEAQAPRGAQAT